MKLNRLILVILVSLGGSYAWQYMGAGSVNLPTSPTSSPTLPNMASVPYSNYRSRYKRETDNGTRNKYPFAIPLDGEGRLQLRWDVREEPKKATDNESADIEFQLEATLPTGSWVAVGFSDRGNWTGSDVCVVWEDWRGHFHLQDGLVDEDGKIQTDREDQEEQNCHKVSIHHDDKILTVTFRRQLNTCDDEDYVIEDGTTHVVYAWGEGPLYSLEGVEPDEKNCGFQRTRLLQILAPPLPSDAKPLLVNARFVRVPADETTYWCHVTALPPEFSRKHHIVQFEAAIQPGHESLVHHMEVFHCVAPANEPIPEYRGPCTGPNRPAATQVCKKVLAAWAFGAGPFAYPEEAGLAVGGPGFNLNVMLEVHYNNPAKKDNWEDSSGIRLWHTTKLRRFDAGVMELGLEYSDKMAIPPQQAEFTLTGSCVPECTAVGIPDGGITVFGSQLHTHLLGTRVVTRHFRNGQELRELNRDNHYSTHFQEIRLLPKPVQVMPGDALLTTCWYDSMKYNNVTLGGFSISDEMCINYIHYFPQVNLEVCKSSIGEEALTDYFHYLEEWDGQDVESGQVISTAYKSIEWTPLRGVFLQKMYEEAPLSMQCNQSSGARFPGQWEGLPNLQVDPALSNTPNSAASCA